MHADELASIKLQRRTDVIGDPFREQATILFDQIQEHDIIAIEPFKLFREMLFHSTPHYTDQQAMFLDHLIVTTSVQKLGNDTTEGFYAWFKRP
ncbi:hypothetical protein D3C71_1846440 [compost metagenome]